MLRGSSPTSWGHCTAMSARLTGTLVICCYAYVPGICSPAWQLTGHSCGQAVGGLSLCVPAGFNLIPRCSIHPSSAQGAWALYSARFLLSRYPKRWTMQNPHPFWNKSRETKNHVSAFVLPVRCPNTFKSLKSKALRYGNRRISVMAPREAKWTQAHSLALKEGDTTYHIHPPKLFLPQSTMASSTLLETVSALCYPLNHIQALLSSLMVGIG